MIEERKCKAPPKNRANQSKRMVFDAGRKKGGGSIEKLVKETGTDLDNIYMHIGQLSEKCGCKCIIDGDYYEILC